MIYRNEYRGCIKKDFDENEFKDVCSKITAKLDGQKYLEVMLYKYKNMLFLYCEARISDFCPEDALKDLNPYLESWPEENGKSYWAYMYPVFYHQTSISDENAWNRERGANKTKIGRIAFLKEEKLFSYVYWHTALVREGLLKGDKYQYISLHENILFSYFEEPRNNINITGNEEESQVIKGYSAEDPDTFFQHEKTGKSNFLVIEPILNFYSPLQ